MATRTVEIQSELADLVELALKKRNKGGSLEALLPFVLLEWLDPGFGILKSRLLFNPAEWAKKQSASERLPIKNTTPISFEERLKLIRENIESAPGPENRGITMGMGAAGAMMAEHEAEMRLQSQGIRTRSTEYACGPARVPKEMTVCVPKEMQTTEIEQKINEENRTGRGPWWNVSTDMDFRTGEPHPCPCTHDPARLHYLLLHLDGFSAEDLLSQSP